jgi:hypothetical protein
MSRFMAITDDCEQDNVGKKYRIIEPMKVRCCSHVVTGGGY